MENVILGVVGICVLTVIWVVVRGYFPVPQGHVVLIERFGQFHRKLKPGINFIIPGLDHPADLSDWKKTACKSYRGRPILIELSEQLSDTGPRSAATKDNVEVEVDASVYWQIMDPVPARYEVDHLAPSVIDMALNVLRTAIGIATLDQALSERTKIAQYMLEQLTKATNKWGVRVIRVEIQSLKPLGEHVGSAMAKEMSAERDRRAMVLLAKGESESTLLKAQANRDARLMEAQVEVQVAKLRAEAELARVERLAERFGDEQGLKTAMVLGYLETLTSMGKDPAAKIYLPSNGQLSTPLGAMLGDFLTERSSPSNGNGAPMKTEVSVATNLLERLTAERGSASRGDMPVRTTTPV